MVVQQTLSSMLHRDQRFDDEQVQKTIEPVRPELPTVTITRPDVRLYDALLSAAVAFMNATALYKRNPLLERYKQTVEKCQAIQKGNPGWRPW
jgi:hypothetical protein